MLLPFGIIAFPMIFFMELPLLDHLASAFAGGGLFLLLAILAILAIVKQQWLQVWIFAGMAGVGAIILFLSANILVVLEFGLEKLKS